MTIKKIHCMYLDMKAVFKNLHRLNCEVNPYASTVESSCVAAKFWHVEGCMLGSYGAPGRLIGSFVAKDRIKLL